MLPLGLRVYLERTAFKLIRSLTAGFSLSSYLGIKQREVCIVSSTYTILNWKIFWKNMTNLSWDTGKSLFLPLLLLYIFSSHIYTSKLLSSLTCILFSLCLCYHNTAFHLCDLNYLVIKKNPRTNVCVCLKLTSKIQWKYLLLCSFRTWKIMVFNHFLLLLLIITP